MNWCTNKAVFSVEEGKVYKKYLNTGSAERDIALLQLIEDIYPMSECNGWRYRALRIFGDDRNSNEIVMEQLHGETLKDAFERTKDPALFLHAGRWLGFLHEASENSSGRVLVFNDYNRSNLILDWDRREVVGLDPGNYLETYVRPGASLFMSIFSLSRGAWQVDPRLFPAGLCYLLYGYQEARNGKNLPALLPGAWYLWRRFRKAQARTLLNRPAALRIIFGAIECIVLFLSAKLLFYRGFVGKYRLHECRQSIRD